MSHETLLAGIAGSLLWLDRFQLCQFMVSRPIVSAPLVGWIVGDFAAGVAAGLLYEFLWLRTPPVGGFIAPDSTLASIATAAVSAGVGSGAQIGLTSVVFLSFLFLFPLCFVGRRVDGLLRVGLGKIAKRAETAQVGGGDRVVAVHLMAGLVLGFVSAFVVLVVTIEGFTFLLGRVVQDLPSTVTKSLGFGFYVVPLLGAADFLLGTESRHDTALFIAGLAAAVAIGSGLFS
ncbi:MAG: PTS sugar transporter subunit IIC [Desulfomonilaceae bacterium]|nr:PTS sugar transporter subunit IIC [Desulfomonilaceae bacterium]